MKKNNKKKEINGNTKIELYPDKKPRYNFYKNPLYYIIPKNALFFSFDKDKEFDYTTCNVPILEGFYIAHTNHYPELKQMIFSFNS